MLRFTIRFSNSNDLPIHVQVDPWAGVYTLAKGRMVELVALSEETSAAFDIEEYGSTRILTILNSSEYFVVRNGELSKPAK